MEKQTEHPQREEEEEGIEVKWSEKVEDLVEAGQTEKAIALLETLVSKLQVSETTSNNNNSQLATALADLAALYNSKGFSLKADALLSHVAFIKQSTTTATALHRNESNNGVGVKMSNESICGESTDATCAGNLEQSPPNADSDDDWEAVADRPDEELLPSQCLTRASSHSLEDTKVQAPKRRGRGTFLFNKSKMYSDQQFDKSTVDDAEDENVSHDLEATTKLSNSSYGTHHVLVLANFSPSLRTIDLEKLFADFTDCGVAIRWINDTTALAAFPTPSIALEAQNHVRCPFTVRILEEDDALLGSIPKRDLEPPCQRPKTSARTAQRLIAQGMGLKLPSTSGSRELKEQEEARRNRIVTRQKLRDDAWGD